MEKKVRYMINDDISFNVLSRLPAKALIGLKCVSREWHNLISDRCFIQAQLERNKLTISGFIFQEKLLWYHQDKQGISYIPVGKESFQLHTRVFDFLPEDVVILSSCNGLVCCRSLFPSDDPSIYICNPLNKEWSRMRVATLDHDTIIALAFDAFENPIKVSTNFKMVRIFREVEAENGEVNFTFAIYSSETSLWRKSNERCICKKDLVKKKGIYIKGVFYWLTNGNEILTFDVENELSCIISVPVPAEEFMTIPQACIGESEGQLCYVMITEEGLHLWCLEDSFESKWALKSSKSLQKMEEEYPQFFYNLQVRVMEGTRNYETAWINPLSFQDGILFMRVSAKIYLHHFETGKVQKVCEVSELGLSSMFFPAVLPYSLSLVPLM
ncbi:hypothetical protein UlMin_002648 [Ulmus minor]